MSQEPRITIGNALFMELHERSSNDMYVLRLWLERDWGEGTPAGWRFSLEDPHTGVLRGFGSLFDLTIFLEGKMTNLAQQYFSRDATE